MEGIPGAGREDMRDEWRQAGHVAMEASWPRGHGGKLATWPWRQAGLECGTSGERTAFRESRLESDSRFESGVSDSSFSWIEVWPRSLASSAGVCPLLSLCASIAGNCDGLEHKWLGGIGVCGG